LKREVIDVTTEKPQVVRNEIFTDFVSPYPEFSILATYWNPSYLSRADDRAIATELSQGDIGLHPEGGRMAVSFKTATK